MFLDELKIVNVRNIEHLSIKFDHKRNYIIGENGSGKTTILESIVTSLYRKSFRTSKIEELKSINSPFLSISSIFIKNGLNYTFTFNYSDKKKLHLINNKKIDKLLNIISHFPLIVHSPYYEGLTDKSNRNKLTFLDKIVILADKSYKENLSKFNKLLKHKRKLITESNDTKLINTINDLLSEIYELIYKKRKNFLEQLNMRLKDYESTKKISIELKKNKTKDVFLNELALKKILLTQYSQKIYITSENKNIENLLSFGQKKELSIFIIYSFLKIIEEIIKDGIIILLDDFEAGLDESKVKNFYEIFSDNQLILTGVDNKYLSGINTICLKGVK
ncbi:conserved hypothetical protein [Deferribacter desulfuricans SSM1]|uniref:DNA replication and repair protein RecF n=1 Tax=Deferribacter desulfuricans (strain DSM 14783 / JCM 11476 / NBRC 101012 / SSM1) TaxID=639282 RepID=D3PA91_DEFDS|nr:AAA family ATPase [Deferribacter desulfuricans]BAI79514.1 conserved hypothetical protein [Deferribacter desulfuricans SSM1]